MLNCVERFFLTYILVLYNKFWCGKQFELPALRSCGMNLI